MGNCCVRRDSAAVWANDDDDDNEWVNVCQLHQSEQPEEEKLLGEVHFRSSASSSSCRGRPSSGGGDHQVKIKMTKRELEELVGSKGGGAMDVSTVDELLSRAINDVEDEEVEEYQQPWRPALQSIPEVD